MITITYNNLSGLQKTARSVVAQRYADMEWLAQVANGGVISGGAGVANGMTNEGKRDFCVKDFAAYRFVSEPDKGVYDAQNKGVGMANGEYCFFLNAGDCFAGEDVLKRLLVEPVEADIVYGNEVVVDAEGRRVDCCRGVDLAEYRERERQRMERDLMFAKGLLQQGDSLVQEVTVNGRCYTWDMINSIN